MQCDANAYDSGCSASITATNKCTCNAGYYGNGLSCSKCLTCDSNAADSGCPSGSAVINSCKCNVGYYGYGVVCTPRCLTAFYNGVQYCSTGSVCPVTARVLVVGADLADSLSNVQSSLVATGAFTAVDTFSAMYATPTLAYLQGYSAVLVFSVYPFLSSSDLGNVLADYWDSGGAVVLTEYAVGFLAASPGVARWAVVVYGRFGLASSGYSLIDTASTAGIEAPTDSLGTVFDSQSPLMIGVHTLTAINAYRCTGNVINGGIVVAGWESNGRALVVRGTRAGRPLVALNVLPFSTSYPSSPSASTLLVGGDIGPLLRNALIYSTCRLQSNVAGSSCTQCVTCDVNAVDSGCAVGSSATNKCTCNAGYYGNGISCFHI